MNRRKTIRSSKDNDYVYFLHAVEKNRLKIVKILVEEFQVNPFMNQNLGSFIARYRHYSEMESYLASKTMKPTINTEINNEADMMLHLFHQYGHFRGVGNQFLEWMYILAIEKNDYETIVALVREMHLVSPRVWNGYILGQAIEKASLEIVSHLVELGGISPSSLDDWPVYVAIRRNDPEIMNYLISRTSLNVNHAMGFPFLRAVMTSKDSIVDSIMQSSSFQHSLATVRLALSHAIQRKNDALAEKLINGNAPFTPQEYEKASPHVRSLMLAKRERESPSSSSSTTTATQVKAKPILKSEIKQRPESYLEKQSVPEKPSSSTERKRKASDEDSEEKTTKKTKKLVFNPRVVKRGIKDRDLQSSYEIQQDPEMLLENVEDASLKT